jgi:hypothetical protein
VPTDYPYLEREDLLAAFEYGAAAAGGISCHCRLVKFLVDAQLTSRLATFLTAHGHHAVHVEITAAYRPHSRRRGHGLGVVVNRNGEPAVVMMAVEDTESLAATLAILQDQQAMTNLAKADAAVASGET